MAEVKKRSLTGRALRQRGLRRRWFQSSILPVLLLVAVIVFLASTGMSNYYYNSMLDGLEQQAQAALDAGLQELCVTDHWNLLDQQANPLPHTRDWTASVAQIQEARQLFADLMRKKALYSENRRFLGRQRIPL